MTFEPIRIWNRKTEQEETEKVYGEGWLNWAYRTRLGKFLTESILSRREVSLLYGLWQSCLFSKTKIPSFIRNYSIDMSEYRDEKYRNFNQFFIRVFKPGKRPFNPDPAKMPAFAEARYLAWEKILPAQLFPVKGKFLTAELLMGASQKAQPFVGGPLLLARLCPVDYHRFHFPDDGRVIETYCVPGPLHSVNPSALRVREDILCTNQRQITILDTRNFGRLAFIEVGALCVGKIVQSYPLPRFKRGDEKGYFLFGGSTVIVLGEPGKWRPSADLLEQTQKKRETRVLLGEEIAKQLDTDKTT